MTWKDELPRMPAPEPPEGLLARILASRAAGVRVVLPAARPPHRRVTPRQVATLGAGAAVVAGLIIAAAVRERHADDSTVDAGLNAWLALSPAEVLAQEPGGRPARTTYPLVENLDRARLVPERLSYLYRMIIDGDGFVANTPLSDTLAISATTFAQTPALAIVSVWVSSRITRDTLIVRTSDLRPLRRACCGHVRSPDGHVRLRDFAFEGHEIGPLFIGHVPDGYPGTRVNPHMALTIGWANFLVLKPLLQTLPLRDGWRGSVYLRFGPYDALPIDIRVTGRERVAVPGGTFDCWRIEVALSGNTGRLTFWVSRDPQIVVRVEQRIKDGVIEDVLTARDATPPIR